MIQDIKKMKILWAVKFEGSKRNGFTLLELVVSITILGIIILIIAGATRLGFRSVESGERKIEQLERLRTSLNTIESQILSEIPLTYTDDDGSKRYYFRGDRDFLLFPTNFSLLNGQRGYVMASYNAVTGQDGRPVLYLSESSIGTASKTETKLLEGFDRISFEYFYKEPAAEEGTWVTQMTDDTIMPEKIAVHIVLGSQDLSMIIPMRTPGSLAQISSPVMQTGVIPSAAGSRAPLSSPGLANPVR